MPMASSRCGARAHAGHECWRQILRLCGMQLQAVLEAKMITDSTRAHSHHSYLLVVFVAFPSALAPGRRFDERR
jgi:hypothetical protein